MSLKQKTIKGLTWSFASQFGKQASLFIITAILARLLSPDDFGLLGMATVFTGFVQMINEEGISGALIQNQKLGEKHYSSVFWLNIFVGALLMLLMTFLSPLIAAFYRKPELSPILMLISLNFITASFVVVQRALFTKELDFKKLAIAETIAVIASGIVAIVLAYKGYGVYSLVYQILILTLINMLALWMLSNWRPKFTFEIEAIKDIFHFSIHMTGFNILNYIARNIDYLLIGKFLGAEPLGYYTLAYKLMLYPLQSISWTIGRVMFPAFSKIQHDLAKVRENYLKMIKAISLITFPMMFGLFAVAPEFIRVVYGPKWEPVILLIQILCFCGLVQSIGTTVGTIYQSQGRADLQFKLSAIYAAMASSSIAVGLQWGLVGVALSYSIFSIIWTHFSMFIVAKIIRIRYKLFYAQLLTAFVFSFVMLLGTFITKSFLYRSQSIDLFIYIFSGSALYAILIYKTKSYEFIGVSKK